MTNMEPLGGSAQGGFIGAPFPDTNAAERIVTQLLAAGYAREEISVAADPVTCTVDFDEFGDDMAGGALGGAVAGGAIGALLSAATEIGGFLIAGPLVLVVGTATGLLGGALAAMLLAAGMPSHNAKHCEDAVAVGKIFVGVHPHDNDAQRVRELLVAASMQTAGER